MIEKAEGFRFSTGAEFMCRRGITLFIFILTAGLTFAQDAKWTPPEPSSVDRDWIRLTSGEWLWGTIELMRDESLYFDSEELDEVTLDWEDVAEIRSARFMTYVMVDGLLATGTSRLEGEVLRVQSADELMEIPRDRIFSILEGRPRELNYWSAKVGSDLKIQSGNTSKKDLGVRVSLKREAMWSRLDFRYQGNFSQAEEVQTINNHRGNAEWKLFLSRRFFLTPLKSEIYSDKFKNIHQQVSLDAGLGYFISRSSKADWFVELGGGYIKTTYGSVQPGEDKSQGNAIIPFRTTLETDLTKSIELNAEYGVRFELGDGGNATHHTFIIFEFDLVGDLDFVASITWDHIAKPKEDAEGVTPKRDDVIVGYGLSFDF
jgi:Protein of unknown function, DUF481